jgi:UDP-glucose 4-epimerase
VRALERIERGRGLTYNVGTGVGVSVRAVIESARRVTRRPIATVEQPRRPGDPPALVAAAQAIGRDLGWSPRFTDIDAIIASAWKWHSTHPNGYQLR